MADRIALGWMAYWHDLVWKAQSTTIDENGTIHRGLVERMENLVLDYSLKTVKIKTKKSGKKKAKTIEATLASNDITFECTYKLAAGTVDINSKINSIKDMIGNAAPLVIANYDAPMVWGSFYMQLTKVATSDVEMDEVGRITQAKVSFTLSEAQDKKVKKQAVTYPAGSTSAILQQFVKSGSVPDQFKSALKICPDPQIKALLKSSSKKK